jgi:hypothetical protein
MATVGFTDTNNKRTVKWSGTMKRVGFTDADNQRRSVMEWGSDKIRFEEHRQ